MQKKRPSEGTVPSTTAKAVTEALARHASPEKARTSSWFFKTGPGQYGAGDQFIGVTVPEQRIVAKNFGQLSFQELEKLLASPIHEHRCTALLILVAQYERVCKTRTGTSSNDRYRMCRLKEIVSFYIAHLDRINNWDLVDVSAHKILGAYYLEFGGEKKLYTLARSKKLWERRVAIVATATFIRAGLLEHTFAIALLVLNDPEDLMHKATGWMLREAGKKDKKRLETFLETYAHEMPRTMLRYALEKFPETERKKWLGVS
jgi:3-methyladenine DNA glycosylase AlkD